MVAAGWWRQARAMLSMNGLLALDGWLALGMIFLLPALEAPAFIGLVLPGELVLVLGGVLAQHGRVPLAAALALGVAGPIAGDAVGHWLGRRFGRRLLEVGAGRLAGPARVARTRAVLQRRGGPALVLGRMTWRLTTGCCPGPRGPGGRSRPGGAGGPWPPGACACRPGPR